jgi:NOL1/NOP2/sun family putative RNA methylase
MGTILGDEFSAFIASLSAPSQPGLRVNTLKVLPEAYQALSPFTLTPIPWCTSGFLTLPTDQAGKHPQHAAGLYYLQEPSAMGAAEILGPLPGERVLDISAAPGGKTTHIAALMQNSGLLVANEIHPRRVWDLAENLERCGVQIAAVTNETPEKLSAHFGAFFDRVLLDAPCSGEGMFRKSVIARTQWTPELVQGCSTRQQAILPIAASLVKPGGTLVYCTCTFSPEENEQVIGRFLHKHPDFNLSPINQKPSYSPGVRQWAAEYRDFPLENTIRIWPHHSIGDGHFIALLRRMSTAEYPSFSSASLSSQSISGLSLEQTRQFQHFLDDNLVNADLKNRLFLSGSYLYQLPAGLPHLDSLKVIHPGWWLGIFKKDRFEPAHALALGLQANQAQRSLDLASDKSILYRYLHGESFPSPGEDGWTVITLNGFPLGWGKRAQGIMKNAYPRGLRWN